MQEKEAAFVVTSKTNCNLDNNDNKKPTTNALGKPDFALLRTIVYFKARAFATAFINGKPTGVLVNSWAS